MEKLSDLFNWCEYNSRPYHHKYILLIGDTGIMEPCTSAIMVTDLGAVMGAVFLL